MFTGIIEEMGKVKGLTPSGALTVEASHVLEGTSLGDSIAVSGVCLTVVDMTSSSFTVDVMPETLKRSVLGSLRPGAPVNLERAMLAGGRLGGHMVQGHADGVGTVRSRSQMGNAVLFDIVADEEVTRYIVEKGSVAIDGISLTVVEPRGGGFSVSIIPRTLSETTLESKRPGDRVNIEVDIIAKYVEAFIARRSGREGIEDALERGGYFLDQGD
ncbi:MAG TPA: riboflavin synthase [Candidatus Anoxymicrobiaceae bacterium]